MQSALSIIFLIQILSYLHHGFFSCYFVLHYEWAMLHLNSKIIDSTSTDSWINIISDDEMLNGALNVTIHKLDGLESPCGM